MWILHFLPDELLTFVVNAVLIFGIVATVLTQFVTARILAWLPGAAAYYKLIQVLSIATLLLGVYLKGSLLTELAWRERVEEARAAVEKAEAQAQAANDALAAKSGEKIKYIRGRTEYITQYIDREVVKYDVKFAPGGECEIPAEFIKSHNDAAEVPKK